MAEPEKTRHMKIIDVDLRPKVPTLGETMPVEEVDPAHEALLISAAEHAPAPLPMTRQVLSISMEWISPSPTNPRKTFTGIDELAKSLKAAGMIVPLIVRPLPNAGFELVAGERRYRAAKKAGLEFVPCDVRELDDTQVFEIQIIENSKRADLTDLEQAEMFEALQVTHGYSVEQIAEKFTVSMGTVYSRLKLLALCAEARGALAEGVVPTSVAVPLARLPTHALQAKALKEMKAKFIFDGENAISSRSAIIWIQKEFSRSLKGAPFKLADSMLVESAGACNGCPKNTATATPGLFEDFAKGTGQTCTDVGCYRLKADAAWKAAAAKAKEEGAEVLDREEGAKLYQHGQLGHGSKYVELDSPNHADPQKRHWRELMERLPEDQQPQIIVAPDKELNRHDLADAAALVKAIAESSGAPKWAKAETKVKEQRAKEREISKEISQKADLRARVVAAAIGKIADKVKTLDGPLVRFIVEQLTEDFIPQATLEGLGLTDRDGFESMMKKADPKQLNRALFMVAVGKGGGLRGSADGYTDEVKVLAKSQGLDLKAIEKAIEDGDAAEALKADADKLFKKGAKS